MVCYKLMNRETGEVPELSKIDEEIATLLGKHADPQQFCYLGDNPEFGHILNWNNTVGLAMAMGKTFDEIRALWHDNQEILKICDYLEQHYEIISWRKY